MDNINGNLNLIEALIALYDNQLANNPDTYYWVECVPADYIVDLNDDGSIASILPAPIAEGKEKPDPIRIPRRLLRSSNVQPYMIFDNSTYVFGVCKKQEKLSAEKFSGMKGKHLAYTIFNQAVLDKCNSNAAMAFKKFLQDPFKASKFNEAYIKELCDAKKNDEATSFWFTYHNQSLLNFDDIESACRNALEHNFAYEAVPKKPTVPGKCVHKGNIDKDGNIISDAHHKIFYGGKKGMSMISYNFKNLSSYNIPAKPSITQIDMLKYTKAMTYLLTYRCRSRINIGENWAHIYSYFTLQPKNISQEQINSIIFANEDCNSDKDEGSLIDSVAIKQRDERNRKIENISEKGMLEQCVDDKIYSVVCAVHFEVRCVIKEVNCGHFADYKRNIAKHYKRCWLEDNYLGPYGSVKHIDGGEKITETVKKRAAFNVYDFANCLLSESERIKKDYHTIPESIADMMASYYRAILNDTDYPILVLNRALERFCINLASQCNSHKKTDNNAVSYRTQLLLVMIIQGFLNKNFNTNVVEGENKMSLDKENTNTAYLLGRLMALYTGMQKEAITGVQKTIDTTYFKTAMSCPQRIYPLLEGQANAYLSKLGEKGKYYYNQVQEIYDRMQPDKDESVYPAILNIADKGRFVLGYWQQRKAVDKYQYAIKQPQNN